MQHLGGDPEAEGAAATSSTMRPAVLDHLQNVLGDMPGRFGGGVSYDPNRSLAQNTLEPESLQQAMTVGMQVGPAAIRAYHGSPHDFNAFDISKIGTGEGAQAYGHGLYFAESPDVAQSYRDMLSAPSYPTLAVDRSSGAKGWSVYNWDAPGAGPGKPIETGGFRTKPDAMAHVKELFAQIEQAAPKGKMYEVNLHADPARLLDWDKPLSAQGKSVYDTMSDLLDSKGRLGLVMGDATGQRIYHELINERAPIGLARLNAPLAVSQQLREAGIPGVKYLDQGSRGAGEGTSNYVMYDDKLIEILRKYGLAGLTAGAGGAAALGGGAGEAQAGALDRLQGQLGRNQEWVRPGEHNYNTPLSGQDEASFRDWLGQNKVPFDVSAPVTDYDMRGFWKGLQSGDPVAASSVNPNDNRMHYPDRWKTPYHETFSAGSQWATPDAPNWTPDDKLIDKYGRTLFDERASPLERLMWQLRGELSPPT
jgi:hypothetical protein